jgi:hypothetical protein
MSKFLSSLKRIWRNYNLSLVLLALFLVSWGLQFLSEMKEVANEAQAHGQAFQWSEFWPHFFSGTFENWQSEFLQLLTFVVLTSFLIHKNSHESRDSDERMEKKIDKILDLVSKK